MNAISGFEPTFEGKVYCNGTDLVQNFQALKSVIGFVPQQDIIYEKSDITENAVLFRQDPNAKGYPPCRDPETDRRGAGYGGFKSS